jgi:hypothetical protein
LSRCTRRVALKAAEVCGEATLRVCVPRRRMASAWLPSPMRFSRTMRGRAVRCSRAEVGSLLDGVLRPAEQRQMSGYVSRLLAATDQEGGT